MADRDRLLLATRQHRHGTVWRWSVCTAVLLGAVAWQAPRAMAASAKPGTQIGAIVPASWPDAAKGEEIRNGMELALKTWPGQPAPTLVVKDSACDPKKAATAAQALLDAKVDIVLGGWCVVGSAPAMLRGASVPYVSSNAERFAAADNIIQFATVPAQTADGIAAKLRSQTGLRVTGGSRCWIDYEERVPEKYDAALCPTLAIDQARWSDIAPTYQAAYRKPFTVSAARGYAAMQVALAYVKQVRAGAKPAAALKDAQGVDTILGRIPARDATTPENAMRLIFAARLPKLSAREAAALDTVVKAKACGVKDGTWSTMPFVLADAKAPCPGVKLTSQK